MIKLGITGNIASGKTLVESFFKEEGIAVIDSDEIVHDLLENNEDVIREVYELFIVDGIDVRNEKGAISREKVGKIVFKDKEKLKNLENMLHPIVKEKIKEFFSLNQDKKIAAAVVPLLFEVNMQGMFDYIVLVTADLDTRLDRLIKRSHLTHEEALLRINSQMPQEEKIPESDFVIDNSRDIEYTREQVRKILAGL